MGRIAQSLAGGEMLVIVRLLGQVTDTLANVQATVDDILSEDAGCAIRRLDEAKQQLYRSALARAVGTEETEDGVLRHAKGKAIQGFEALVRLSQSLCRDYCRV